MMRSPTALTAALRAQAKVRSPARESIAQKIGATVVAPLRGAGLWLCLARHTLPYRQQQSKPKKQHRLRFRHYPHGHPRDIDSWCFDTLYQVLYATTILRSCCFATFRALRLPTRSANFIYDDTILLMAQAFGVAPPAQRATQQQLQPIWRRRWSLQSSLTGETRPDAFAS